MVLGLSCAGLAWFVGWCTWTAFDMPSRVHSEAAQYFGPGLVRVQLSFHTLRAVAFLVPLALLVVLSGTACVLLVRRRVTWPAGAFRRPSRRHIRALASSLVVLACLVTTPVIANRDPPRYGAALADQSALVPDWPPWYDSGFWTVRISDVPGAVMNYVSATCPTSEVCLAWGETPDFKSVFKLSTDGGATWREVGTSADFPVMGNIACWDRSHCVIAGSPPEVTSDGGRHWGPVDGNANASAVAVSCPSAGPSPSEWCTRLRSSHQPERLAFRLSARL